MEGGDHPVKFDNPEGKWAEIKRLSNTVPCLESTRYIVAKIDNEEELHKCLLT